MTNNTEQQFISISELSKLIHISVSTINRLVSEGKIPSYKVEKRRLFKKAEILEWMEGYRNAD